MNRHMSNFISPGFTNPTKPMFMYFTTLIPVFPSDPTSTLSSVSVVTPAVGLVRKLLSVLESMERLPVFSHDSPGQVFNLQTINRRLRFSLERGSGSPSLLDCSGKTLKVEPLVSVDRLEKFLNGIVSLYGDVGSPMLNKYMFCGFQG